MCAERFVETKIAHDCGHDGVLLKPAATQKIDSCDAENLIAIHNLAVLVAKQDAISVAIMRDANVCVGFPDESLDFLGVDAATAVVDIHAVWLVVRDGDVRAELAQNARR